MRESLSLRLAVLAVLLPATAAACAFALVATGVLHPRIAYLVLAGGAILIIAILAAAISALGPKYRPTPLLTPLFAGIFAALLTTTAIYAAHAHIAPKRGAVAAVAVKPAVKLAAKPVMKPVEPAPLQPAPAAPDGGVAPSIEPAFDAAMFSPPQKAQDQLSAAAEPVPAAPVATAAAEPMPNAEPMPEPEALPADEPDGSAMGGPLVQMANAVVTPAKAEERPAVAAHQKKTTAMGTRIPVPATAPDAPKQAAKADPNAPINLTVSFDPSGPTAPTADGPPMELDAADAGTAAHHAAIPPLPRIRPCGVGGPACP